MEVYYVCYVSNIERYPIRDAISNGQTDFSSRDFVTGDHFLHVISNCRLYDK